MLASSLAFITLFPCFCHLKKRDSFRLWDTAGQEKFKSITRSYYRNSAGVIVVYDITNRKTFDHVTEWLAEAEANVSGPDPSQCVFQLIGHKADLDKAREVLYEEGEYFAKYHKIKFIETSAFSGDNVNVSHLRGWTGIETKVGITFLGSLFNDCSRT